MPPWQKKSGENETFLKFLRFQDFLASQGDGKYHNPTKVKGKGKGKGQGKTPNAELGTGLNLNRPLRRDEPLYAGRTVQEVTNIISHGGWVGKRQYGKHGGEFYTGIYKEGDLTCSRCKSATCRPWKEECWVCGASLPGGGTSKDSSKKRPPGRESKPKEPNGEVQGTADEDDMYMLPKASEMASVKKRPPSTAATVLASASLKTRPTFAEVVTNTPSTTTPSPPSPPADCSPTPASDADILNGTTLGKVKALVAELPATTAERLGLVKLLENTSRRRPGRSGKRQKPSRIQSTSRA